HLSHLRQIFSVLRAQKLYANGKKCHFFVIEVTFLGYIVTGSSIKIDPTKVEVIISWPTPSTIHDIRSFHRLASFYRRFIRNFSSIIAPLTECMKGGRFTWTSEAAKAFDILKAKVTEAPILALPNFDRAFQVKCDASRVGIGGVQSQNQRPIPFFSEKLNVVRRKYSTYDKEFYAIAFLFVIRHKVGSDNQVADALSRHHSLITTMQIRVQGFDLFRGLYCDDPDFREIWSKCDNAIILEGHAGGLAGHFGHDNTLALLREQFYWPKMERDVNRLIKRCRACRIAKTHSSNAGLSVPVAPWKDVSLDFVLEIVKLHGVPKTLTSDRDVKFVSHFWRTLWTRLGYKLQFNSSHLPQTDGQTEVVNQSLGNLLRSLIGDNAKQWDLILPQAEFSYNRSVNRTTGKSPFEVVFGQNPITPLDLIPVPEVGQFSKEGADQSEQIKELHRSVQEQIIRHNKQYKKHADKRQKQILYREGDLVWIHLCKERFPARRFGKLKPRGDGPFCVLKKINENAYKIEVPGHYNVSATFNVTDLSPYNGDSDDEPDSGSSLFQEGEDDADTVNAISCHFSLDKIKQAVWSCGCNQAPGPDGFTFRFIKQFWDIIKEDIQNFVNEFYEHGTIPVGCNSSFTTLIPKVSIPISYRDYRPISLIGIQYKIVAKLLANRMVKVIDDLVHPVQSAFVKGHQILDVPMVVNEVIEWYKKKKKKYMLFKVDLDKVYDSVSWDYLLQIMTWMGFNEKWIQWIRACLISSRASILVNGSPTKEFPLQRGLRQGDPLSPFLFILAIEGLHVAMEDAVEHGIFCDIRAGLGEARISHIFYADDAMFMGEWDAEIIGNGRNARFWLDLWIGDQTLKERFPRVFALKMIKECSVADRWRIDNWNWNWMRNIHTEGRTGQQFLNLLFVLQGIDWLENEDVWRWELDQDELKKHTTYDLVYLLIKLVLILPVATASVERTFSAMTYVKNKLRNSIGDQFLNDCLVTYIEKDVFFEVSDDTIMNRFQRAHVKVGTSGCVSQPDWPAVICGA
ncbi:RNA-directed DNA polymerase, partial [Tanacetum coccineum]